jgi:CubicO group peptidase (beta-lactamase class C family)
MVPSRPRRTAFRRAFPILAALAVVPVISLTLGPVQSAQRLTGPLPPALPRATPAREEPAVIHSPAPDRPTTVVVPVVRQPWRPMDGPSATATMRLALNGRLDKIRTKYAMPGISVTVIFPDGTSWTGVSGQADIAGDVPVTADTAFALASVTKTFTAALIMTMVEAGEIELDATVLTYLPGLRVDPKVTVRQLLDHTSGLRDYFFHPAIDRILVDHPDRVWTETEAFKYVGKPYFKPGRGWHYSNTNYLVLGMIAERVGGASLADLYRDVLLDPLGLDGTFYQPTETARGPVAHGYRFSTSAKDAAPIDLTAEGPTVPVTRWSRRLGAPARWRRRRAMSRAGHAPCTAAVSSRPRPSRRWSTTWPAPNATGRACPMAWASSCSRSTVSRRSATRGGCWGSARPCATCPSPG